MTDNKHTSLAERADVAYATVGRGKRVHYSPRNDETLCGRFIGQYANVEDVVELLDEKGFDWCTRCTAAAEQRAEAARTAESSPLAAATGECEAAAPTFEPGARISVPLGRGTVLRMDADSAGRAPHVVFHLDGQPEGDESTIVSDSPHLLRLCDTCDTVGDDSMPGADTTCGYCLANAAPERRVVEGVIVEHQGVSEGSVPKHATHPDVIAAREALRPLKPATLTDHIDTGRDADERDIDRSVRGYMIEPRSNGRVAAYWIEDGLHTLPDGEPHRVELGILRDTFKQAGWAIEPKSLTCVFAWRPTSGTQDVAAAELAETVEAVEQAEGTWRGGWIASTPPPTGDVLFDLGPDDEQGALFA